MRHQPWDIERAELVSVLRAQWSLPVTELRYAPVGFGDHHWVATRDSGERWFVTVTDLRKDDRATDAAFDALRAAMETAVVLATDAGLDFVVAPLTGRGGAAVERLGAGYAITAFPYVAGTPGHFDDVRTASERSAIVDLLAELHRATPRAPEAQPIDPALPGRASLEAALSPDTPPPPRPDGARRGGPYSGPARELLARHAPAVRAALRRFDELAAQAGAEGRMVVTHGEPHPGNVLRAGRRRLLIDWDTVRLAPPERDLWMVGDHPDIAARYARRTGHPVSEAAMAFYRLRWDLDDITVYLNLFQAPHERTPDTRLAWAGFRATVERLAMPPR